MKDAEYTIEKPDSDPFKGRDCDYGFELYVRPKGVIDFMVYQVVSGSQFSLKCQKIHSLCTFEYQLGKRRPGSMPGGNLAVI